MKKLPPQSMQSLLRRAAIIQAHTNAPTRDTASLVAFMATAGDQEYATRFGQAAASLDAKGYSLADLANRVKTGAQDRIVPGFERERGLDGPDLPLQH